MRLNTLLAVALLLLASGCSTFTPREVLQGQGNAQAWQVHKAQTSQIDGWQISGKLGIRAPQDSGSGTLFWLQRQDYFDIRLSGPLGRGAARLTGRDGAVNLEIANQGRYQGESAQELLGEQLGWQLPVSQLHWWIRGLPAPGSRSQLTLDSDSRLAALQQDGWQLQFLDYRDQHGFSLPQRLKAQRGELQIILVIKDWQARQLGH